MAPVNESTDVDVRSPITITLVDDGPAPLGVVNPATLSLLYFDTTQTQRVLSFKRKKSGSVTTLMRPTMSLKRF